MKKRLIVFSLILIFSLMGFVSAQTCTDSDNGRLYNTKGFASGFLEVGGDFKKLNDTCWIDSSKNFNLDEIYCDKNFLKIDTYKCPEGCKNGVCCQAKDLSCPSKECIDSDNGANFYIKGKISGITRGLNWAYTHKALGSGTGTFLGLIENIEDFCVDDPNYIWNAQTYAQAISNKKSESSNLIEFKCEGGFVQIVPTQCPPPGVCKDGACTKEACIDSDQGNNPFVKGTICALGRCKIDNCINETTLEEFYCAQAGGDISEFYCPQGCRDGACLGASTEPAAESTACGADQCEMNGNCYPIGYRKGGNYCSDIGWTRQKQGEEACDNNFECSSNVCVDSKCISAGLVRKIINWFKNLFG